MITEVALVGYGVCQITDESSDMTDDSPTGYFLQGSEIMFTDKTDTIRSVNGLAFGIEYLLKGVEDENAELFDVCIKHPQMINPESKAASTEVTEAKVGSIGETSFDYYRFEYPWETQPGEWLFEVKQNNRLLLQKRFDVQL